jgi:plastocyanin
MSRRVLTGALALSLAAVLGGATSAPAAGGEFTTRAKIIDNAFSPKRIEIGQGTRIVWRNRGANTHTVTSNTGLFDSGNIAPGEKFAKKFKKTGVFKFHCEIHPEMHGKVISGDV